MREELKRSGEGGETERERALKEESASCILVILWGACGRNKYHTHYHYLRPQLPLPGITTTTSTIMQREKAHYYYNYHYLNNHYQYQAFPASPASPRRRRLPRSAMPHGGPWKGIMCVVLNHDSDGKLHVLTPDGEMKINMSKISRIQKSWA